MRLLVLALALVILAGVGCKKETAENSTENPRAAAMHETLDQTGQSGGPAGDANLTPEERKQLEQEKHGEILDRDGISPEELKQTQELVIKLAPEYGLTYSKQDQTLQPKDPAQPSFDLEQIAMIIMQKYAENPNGDLTEAVRAILKEIASAKLVASTVVETPPTGAAAPEADAGAAGPAPPAGGSGVAPSAPAGLPQAVPGEKPYIKAPDVTGEWQSIREEYERHTFQHDDKWYEFMQLFWQDPKSSNNLGAVFYVYREGKLFSNTTFDYIYVPETALLQLLDKDSGKVVDQYECFMREGDEKTLYLRSLDPGNPKTIVYKYVSRGNKPATPEEEEQYKKVTELIKEGKTPPKDPSKLK